MARKTADFTLLTKPLLRLAELFAIPFHRERGVLLAGDLDRALRHWDEFPGDPTGLEAFVNHFHLDDLAGDSAAGPVKRKDLMRLGESLVSVWASRLAPTEEPVVFYLGGRDGVVLRFHLVRPGAKPWIPADAHLLAKERLRVFELKDSTLRRVS
jgi:hypothetical protein